jgi:transcriptional regulator with XRE-family HTH domain
VAEAAGTKRDHLAAIEKGETSPRPATLGRLAEVLGVTVPRICALADVLGLAPSLLDRTGGPADFGAIEAAVRWATLFRDAEPVLLSFMQPFSAGGRQLWNTPDAGAHREAAALWERLRPYTVAERRVIVQEGKAYQVWALCVRLCDESIEAAADDPVEALEHARLAELIAPLVDGSDAFRSRLSGYCAFHVSSAHCACGSLPASDEALQRAEMDWSAGAAGDPGERLAEARVLGLKASLPSGQGDRSSRSN